MMNRYSKMACLRICVSVALCLLATAESLAQGEPAWKEKRFAQQPGEQWWGAAVNLAHEMPFRSGAAVNLYGDNFGNQAAPLLLSSAGRYVWSEQPFRFSIEKDSLVIRYLGSDELLHGSGSSLQEAFKEASARYFAPSGKMPDTALFTAPQYNTWIELIYDQNQDDILQYARGIIDNGFPPGVLMIDDNWFASYGSFRFRKDRFPDARKMIEELHRMGFTVMVWVCPFISADTEAFREAMAKRLLLFDNKGADTLQWQNATEPALVHWWNGYSAVLDLSNPAALQWFKEKLDVLREEYGVDGFKFDAGDAEYYTKNILAYKQVAPNDHSALWGELGLSYPLNEYRAMWKNGGEPLVERLRDKLHTWEDLQKLVPHACLAGMLGYPFVCPDMIGGGDFSSFIGGGKLDQDLVVRSAQCHALMPMMQFSVAPWRVLDSVHLAAVKAAVALRAQMLPLILQLTREAARTGMPVVRSMEFQFPHQGFAEVNDQFMLGDSLLVAPVLERGPLRRVLLPKGKWKEMQTGKIFRGPVTLELKTTLDVIPCYKRV